MQGLKRSHRCTEVGTAQIGTNVTVMGWVQKSRNKGGIIFVDLRDRSGILQIIFEESDCGVESFAKAEKLRSEFVIAVTGRVEARSGAENKNLATGAIEVRAESLRILSESETPPFPVEENSKTKEELRLKYRYLDLRNPAVKKNIVLRCNVISALRAAMAQHDFLEITTPILTASSPEGARDYLVPARKHPGKFYALPQAPQQFKQLLMTAGFDRYFQIAPCFRDEDARGDRSPGEFYQLDMEMAFASEEDVFAVIEDVLPPIFARYGTYNRASSAPFQRITYLDAMENFGTDKPDLRIDLRVKDAPAALYDCGFGPFDTRERQASEGVLTIKAVVVSDFHETRKFIDKTLAEVEVVSGGKPYWFRLDENGEIVGGIAKFVQPIRDEVISALNLKPNDFVALAAGKQTAAWKTAGVLVKTLGAAVPGHMDREQYAFCWIVDFPMYEIGEESGELEFCHNPFSMPNGGLEPLLLAEQGKLDPLDIRADQYDLVCNGVELSSGAVRNHDPEIMIEAFRLVRLGASPRAGGALVRACRASAWMAGRDYVIPADVGLLFYKVMEHRLVLDPQARLNDRDAHSVLEEIFREVQAPKLIV